MLSLLCFIIDFYFLDQRQQNEVQNEQRGANPKNGIDLFDLALADLDEDMEDEARRNSVGNAVAKRHKHARKERGNSLVIQLPAYPAVAAIIISMFIICFLTGEIEINIISGYLISNIRNLARGARVTQIILFVISFSFSLKSIICQGKPQQSGMLHIVTLL